MPPSSRKRTSTSYSSDDGFVDDSHDEPRPKKVKSENAASKPKKAPARATAAREELPGGGALDEHGDEFWELTSNRRVVVSRFGGKAMVSVREYYEKDGRSLPGKKGISMPIAQLSSLIALLPHIETVLKSKGETLPRPEYDKVDAGVRGGGGGKANKWAEVTDEADGGGKKNFEATSEEE
ncbi:hypothetical protein MMC27_004161 [Xylographa pallens]|nr:hypothetical protein [Xylographa pallens]